MKHTLLITATVSSALFFGSCSGTDTVEDLVEEVSQEVEEVIESVKYNLDRESSSLAWKGSEGEHEFHTGTVDFADGSITMQGDKVESGAFEIDMSTISVTDDMPDAKKAYLASHLSNPDFFDVEKYPSATVTLGDYADGKLSVTLNVMGTDIETAVPVSITSDENEVTIEGDFSVDFAVLNMPGMEEEEGEDESISPSIEYTLKAVLKK